MLAFDCLERFRCDAGSFWGSGFHVERFIDAVSSAAHLASIPGNKSLLVDAGAAPYNTIGGDISHVLTFAKHWPARSGSTIMGFEPGAASFSRLASYVEEAVHASAELIRPAESEAETMSERPTERPAASGRPDGARRGAPTRATSTPRATSTRVTPTRVVRDGAREWIVLRNAPLSDRQQAVHISNQPYAGDNTASLEGHYQQRGRGRLVHSRTLDAELRQRSLSGHQLLVLKVDVEGHEMAVLRGARAAIDEGRVFAILLECECPPSRHAHSTRARLSAACARLRHCPCSSVPSPSSWRLSDGRPTRVCACVRACACVRMRACVQTATR